MPYPGTYPAISGCILNKKGEEEEEDSSEAERVREKSRLFFQNEKQQQGQRRAVRRPSVKTTNHTWQKLHQLIPNPAKWSAALFEIARRGTAQHRNKERKTSNQKHPSSQIATPASYLPSPNPHHRAHSRHYDHLATHLNSKVARPRLARRRVEAMLHTVIFASPGANGVGCCSRGQRYEDNGQEKLLLPSPAPHCHCQNRIQSIKESASQSVSRPVEQLPS